jgi:hypothetical protein
MNTWHVGGGEGNDSQLNRLYVQVCTRYKIFILQLHPLYEVMGKKTISRYCPFKENPYRRIKVVKEKTTNYYHYPALCEYQLVESGVGG